MNTIHGCRPTLLREGFLNAGIADGAVLIFSELMDSASFFLTGNADTVYFWSFLGLTSGPLVVQTPAETLGAIDDMWFPLDHRIRSPPAPTAAKEAPTC